MLLTSVSPDLIGYARHLAGIWFFTWVTKMDDLVTVVPSDYKFNLCVFFNDVKLFILNDAIL